MHLFSLQKGQNTKSGIGMQAQKFPTVKVLWGIFPFLHLARNSKKVWVEALATVGPTWKFFQGMKCYTFYLHSREWR